LLELVKELGNVSQARKIMGTARIALPVQEDGDELIAPKCQAAPLVLEQFAHQPPRRPIVTPTLNQQVEDLALAVNGTPQMHSLAGDPNHRLVEAPAIACRGRYGVAVARSPVRISAPRTGWFRKRCRARSAKSSSTSYRRNVCWMITGEKRWRR
jgi:hypothetical protein